VRASAAWPPGTLRLGVPVTAVDPAAGRATAGDDHLTADLLVAADGINSAVRAPTPGVTPPVSR
jgi:2-polyprenyl-6-methoxyphenol hydroxylase-like FAD-dependent oxidoreductase